MRLREVWHLHVDGQLIRTTGEHPFYAYDKGWTPAQELTPEDWILTDSGDWKPVNEIWNTGELETVYNLRVADHHTYFVGDVDWGWSAWVHNSYEDVLVYRVEGPGNERVIIGSTGSIEIPVVLKRPKVEEDLYINFENWDRAKSLLATRLSQGHANDVIKSFFVKGEFANKVRNEAILESEKTKYKDGYLRPYKVDLPHDGQYGIKSDYIKEMRKNILPGSGHIPFDKNQN